MFFTTVSKITKGTFIKIFWQLKTPTQTWKCTHCIMQMTYLYWSDFPFKNFCKLAQHAETIQKKCLGKEWWRVLVVDKSKETTINHISICFLPQYQRRSKKSFSERELKKVLRDTLTWACGMDSCRQRPSNFLLVRSEHAHASYPRLSRCPGSAPIWGGKKGEFRDWTTFKRLFHCSKFIGNLSLEFLMFHLFAYLAIIIFLSISSLFKITLLHVSGKFYSNNRLLSGMPEAKKCKIL